MTSTAKVSHCEKLSALDEAVLDALRSRPGASAEIASALGVRPAVAISRLRRLARLGLVEKRGGHWGHWAAVVEPRPRSPIVERAAEIEPGRWVRPVNAYLRVPTDEPGDEPEST
jgi:hypothetical protein